MKKFKVRKISFWFVLVSFVYGLSASAAELAGVKMDDTKSVESTNLKLNGVGLRSVTRFGFNIKVYVGGLYLPEKAQDLAAIYQQKGPKQIVMEFLVAVDREALIETFDASFKGNCQFACDKKSEQFSLIKQHLVPMRKGSRMIFTVLDDKLIFEVEGANKKRVSLDGADRAKNLLAMFLNSQQPPSPELRRGLLGL